MRRSFGRGQSKYGNIKTEYDSPLHGLRLYDSKWEAEYAHQLDILVRAGEIRSWAPQVSVPVPRANARMVIDFLVINVDGTVEWHDTKGAPPTRDWTIKQSLVAQIGIDVQIKMRPKKGR